MFHVHHGDTGYFLYCTFDTLHLRSKLGLNTSQMTCFYVPAMISIGLTVLSIKIIAISHAGTFLFLLLTILPENLFVFSSNCFLTSF